MNRIIRTSIKCILNNCSKNGIIINLLLTSSYSTKRKRNPNENSDASNDSPLKIINKKQKIENTKNTEKIENKKNIEKKQNKKAKRVETANLLSRKSTDKYEFVKDASKIIQEYFNIPIFTNEDNLAKQRIWNYKEGYSAFSDTKVNGKGDHIFGIRENSKNNMYGFDNKWNLLPCTHYENITWKKTSLNKNLVYDTFNEDELHNLNNKEYENYIKLYNWIEYCNSKNVKLYFTNENINIEKYSEKCANESYKLKKSIFNEMILEFIKGPIGPIGPKD